MRDMQNDVFYLKEAFKKLSTLNEDSFDLTSDVGVIDELQSFVADDIDAPYEEEIIDIDADNNEELLDSYVGKGVLQCNCCNTKVYKDIKDIIVDEETETANVEEECPKCGNAFGWTVIGKIEPFDEKEFEEVVDDQQPTIELELTDDEISEVLKESLNEDVDIHVGETPEGELKVEVEADDQDIIEIEKENIDDVVVDVDENLNNKKLLEEVQDGDTIYKLEYWGRFDDRRSRLYFATKQDALNYGSKITTAKNPDYPGDKQADSYELYKITVHKDTNGKIDFEDDVKFIGEFGDVDESCRDESLNEEKKTYMCDDCGYEVELDDKEYTGQCPNCGEHHGFYELNESANTKHLVDKFVKYVDENGTNDINVTKLERETNGYFVELERDGIGGTFNANCKFKDNGDILYLDTAIIDEDDNWDDRVEEAGGVNWALKEANDKDYIKFNNYDSFIDYITDMEVIDNGYVDPNEKFYDAEVIFTKNYHMTDINMTKDDKDYYKNYFLKLGITLNDDNSLDIPAGYKTHINTLTRNKHGDVSRLYLPYKLSIEFDPVKLKKDGIIITGINESLNEADTQDNADKFIKSVNAKYFKDLKTPEEYATFIWNADDDLVKILFDEYEDVEELLLGMGKSKEFVDKVVNILDNMSAHQDLHYQATGEFKESLDSEDVAINPETSVEHDQKLENPEENPVMDERNEVDLKESIDNLSLDTDTTHMEMTSDDNGKVTIVTEPREEVEEVIETGEEMIAPLTDEDQTEIMNNEEDVVTDDGSEFEIDEFDEESFDELGESFLKRVYENVNSFKTVEAKYDNNKLYVEGLIKFNSGKEKKTTFKFENFKKSKKGKLVISGLNETFAKNKKAFSLKGSLVNKHFVSESLVYKYNTKNINEGNKNEVVNVFGKVVIKK